MITTEIANRGKIFDKTKPTCLATDWSRDGIGFWFFRNTILFAANMDRKLLLVGSRFTHSTECRYAPIKGEALAEADALDKTKSGM